MDAKLKMTEDPIVTFLKFSAIARKNAMLLSMATVKAHKSGSGKKELPDEVRIARAKGGFLVHEQRPYTGGPMKPEDHRPTVHTSIHKAFRHAKQLMGGANMPQDPEEAGEQAGEPDEQE